MSQVAKTRKVVGMVPLNLKQVSRKNKSIYRRVAEDAKKHLYLNFSAISAVKCF